LIAHDEPLTLILQKDDHDAPLGILARNFKDSVVCVGVRPASAFDCAGVEVGDKIMQVNEIEVTGSRHLADLLAEAPVGAVTLDVVRFGASQKGKSTVCESPSQHGVARQRNNIVRLDVSPSLERAAVDVGLHLKEAVHESYELYSSEQLAKPKHLWEKPCVFVTCVQRCSLSAAAGFAAGDEVVSIDGAPPQSAQEVLDALSALDAITTVVVVR